MQALEKAWSPEFKEILRMTNNPYGDGGGSAKVIEILHFANLDTILKKKFYDCER